MRQLTLGQILDFAAQLRREGISLEEFRNMPIYLGNDDELNGIHCGWYMNLVDPNSDEDADLVELINDDNCNIELKGKAILIS